MSHFQDLRVATGYTVPPDTQGSPVQSMFHSQQKKPREGASFFGCGGTKPPRIDFVSHGLVRIEVCFGPNFGCARADVAMSANDPKRTCRVPTSVRFYSLILQVAP